MAGRARLIQTNMGGGEISRASRARPDTDIYSGALERCRNNVVRPSGALDRRAGSVYVGAAKNANSGKRWFLLKKGINDAVLIEAGWGKFRFWDPITRAQITSGGSPVEVTIPWSDDELATLRVWQQGDVMWFADTGHAYRTRVLKRTSANSFTLGNLTVSEGPFQSRDASAPVLTFSAETGAISITSPTDYFTADMVNGLIRLESTTLPYVSSWSFDQKTIVGEFCRNGNRIYVCTASVDPFKTGNNPPVHDEGVYWDGNQDDNVQWQFVGYTYGLAKITGYTNAKTVSAQVQRRLPFYGAAAKTSDYWLISALMDEVGWPAAGAIFEDRQALFGSAQDPDRCFLSRTSQWTPDSFDMRPGFPTETLDDDAVRRSLAEGETAYIVWALVMDGLMIGTTLGVRQLSGPSADEALTPAGAVPRTVSEIPCSVTTLPLKADNALLYLAVGEEELIELSRINDAVPRNLLEMADHMAGGGLRSICWQGRPRRVMWGVDRVGRLVSMTYAPENGTIAWARHRLGGSLDGRAPYIDDVCTAPGPDGRDYVWLIVARTVNGVTVRSVEYLERPYDSDTMRAEDACCLDMAGYYDLWQSYTIKAVDLGDGVVRLTAQGGATPFTALDIGRQFWLTGNPAIYDPEDDEPGPVKFRADTLVSDGILTGELVGTYPAAAWQDRILRVARPARTFSGLAHLEGEEVYVNADGRRLGPFTVSGSGLTLHNPGDPVTSVWSARGWIGKAYSSLVRTLPVNGGEGLGSARTAVGRVTGIGVMPDGICEGLVRRLDGAPDREVQLNPRQASAPMGQSVPPLTEDQYIPLDAGFDRSKQVEILADGPLPCSIAGFMLKVENYG